jgi:uncharacterized protein (DUF433 family)
MTYPQSPYVEYRAYSLYISGTRVTLETVITYFQDGKAPEQIVQHLPTAPLSHVYGAIAFYLDNKELVDEYIAEGDRIEASIPPLSLSNPTLYAKLETARRRLETKSA